MLSFTTLTTVLGGVSYYVHPHALRSITGLKHGPVLRPAVILSARRGNITNATISERLRNFAADDDVYQQKFSELILFQSVANEPDSISARDPTSQLSFKVETEHDLLPEGPYFVLNGAIHQAWRLYADTLGAFVEPFVPEDALRPHTYSALQTVTEGGIHRSVAVPSRLYASPSRDKPLAGIRISLKDNIRVAGVKTTMMNRAYTDLYPPEKESAAVVEKLTSLGAVLVGKTKMCAFASAEEPTDQWVDYHCPWNPRGDFYQSPSGSTTGGGASLAGYQWLDYSIGTDTSGSIRSPAAYNGLFSLRTTFNSAPMTGIVESCRLYDTIGIMSRSIQGCHHMAKSLLNVTDVDKLPKKLLYPLDFFPQQDEEQQKMMDLFVAQLEDFLGVKKTEISFAEVWATNTPPEAKGKALTEYVDKSAAWPMYWYTYHAFDDFRSEYTAEFGKDVYVGPYMQIRWGVGAEVTEQQRDDGMKELEVFRAWFQSNVMPLDEDNNSEAVLVMPFGGANPQYRDVTHAPPGIASTVNPFYLAPVLQTPQLIVPIGQKRYESRVSGRDEFLPIVGSLMGAKKSDLLLTKIASGTLAKANWPTSVQTGRLVFDLGNNPRNTKDVDNRSMQQEGASLLPRKLDKVLPCMVDQQFPLRVSL